MKKPREPQRRQKPGDTSSSRDPRDVAGDNDERVREASEESFPASDAPSFVATTGSLADGRDKKTPKHRR